MNQPTNPESNRNPGFHQQNELDALLYFLSHDLRAPLRGIDGYSQALIEDYSENLDPMAKAYLEYIHASSRRLSDMIEGLLKLYRIGKTDMEIEPVDLSEIASDTAREFVLRDPQRTVRFKIAPGLVTQADRSLMVQLLSCLIDNSLKFTTNHTDASIEFNTQETPGERVYYLRDNGAGFQMAYQDRLFLPFQRLHGQHEYPGLGLGLAIAQKIVARHGGQIWAEGEPGRGATFFFTIYHPSS